MNFDVYGPLELKRHGPKNRITKDTKESLRAEMESSVPGLSDTCGCYVFAIRAGKGYTPHYVGRAEKKSILNEALNPSNILKYNNVLDYTKGRPMLFALPMLTPQNKFHKLATGKLNSLRFLERWLIAECLKKNPALVNNKETKFLRSIHVTGLLNATQGESHNGSRALSKAIW